MNNKKKFRDVVVICIVTMLDYFYKMTVTKVLIRRNSAVLAVLDIGRTTIRDAIWIICIDVM